MRIQSIASAGLASVALMLGAQAATAQVDLSGNWAARLHEDYHSRGPGPNAVDYLGIPLNAQGRANALGYSADTISEPQRQCLYWPPHYLLEGPFSLKLWADTDPVNGAVVAWNISGSADRAPMKIWMDGRPRPDPDALRSQAGFTIGQWQGDTLVATTTNIKDGYLTRNGVPSSDQETLTLWISRHEETLTVTGIIQDPDYLSEPYVLSRDFKLDPQISIPLLPPACIPEDEVPSLATNPVPHFLPGRNPALMDMTKLYHIPLEAVLGGAQTMYPEFRKKIKAAYTVPGECSQYCCGWGLNLFNENTLLECKRGP
ncbi:MAG TPA: hypothetical protein VHX52_04455 [Steroidobacteraceae bacterium]|jgi:hypothetical protein|nr:hypothetical protein [Steroidobacteraceae bacterium]